jgi:hypothetical protein
VTTQYKWLPSEPTGKLLDLCEKLAINYDFTPEQIYEYIFNAAPAVEQKPAGFIGEDPHFGIRMCSSEAIAECWLTPYSPLYTHPQPDQTALIDQLTDELNKTEAERVKWMSMALSLQPKREPINDDELNSLRQRDNGKLNFVTLREFREIAKVIEKAHGITSDISGNTTIKELS